jgi:hypothetical protein
VPEDQLLIFNVKQGWKPLCNFLGLPVPSKPFPNVNDTKNFRKLIQRVQVGGLVVTYGLPLVFAFLAFVFARYLTNIA